MKRVGGWPRSQGNKLGSSNNDGWRVVHPKFLKSLPSPNIRVPHPSTFFVEGWEPRTSTSLFCFLQDLPEASSPTLSRRIPRVLQRIIQPRSTMEDLGRRWPHRPHTTAPPEVYPSPPSIFSEPCRQLRQVVPLSVTLFNSDEGAIGASLLGTGDVGTIWMKRV